MIAILTSPRIAPSDVQYLERLIEKHHKLYMKLFGKLSFKYHNLVHYPKILLEGPPITYWSMRFEARHQQLKASAQSTANNMNLKKTIAIKQMLLFCDVLRSLEFKSYVKLGAPDLDYVIPTNMYLNLKNNEESNNYSKEVQFYNYVEISGIIYNIGTFVLVELDNIEKTFGEIVKIIKIDNTIFFYLNEFEEHTFSKHLHSYILKPESTGEVLKKFEDLPKEHPCISVIKDMHYVITRYGF